MALVLVTAHDREPNWIESLRSVFDATGLMKYEHIGVPVVQTEGYLVGILIERDYVHHVIHDHRATKHTSVSEGVTREVGTMIEEITLHDWLVFMKDHHKQRLPVMRSDYPIDILGPRDLFLTNTDGSHDFAAV